MTIKQISASVASMTAVAQLDRVTQQNASMVEQSASIADSLSHRADRLGAAMAVFA